MHLELMLEHREKTEEIQTFQTEEIQQHFNENTRIKLWIFQKLQFGGQKELVIQNNQD